MSTECVLFSATESIRVVLEEYMIFLSPLWHPLRRGTTYATRAKNSHDE